CATAALSTARRIPPPAHTGYDGWDLSGGAVFSRRTPGGDVAAPLVGGRRGSFGEQEGHGADLAARRVGRACRLGAGRRSAGVAVAVWGCVVPAGEDLV